MKKKLTLSSRPRRRPRARRGRRHVRHRLHEDRDGPREGAEIPVPDAPRDRQGRPRRLPDLRHEARPDRGGEGRLEASHAPMARRRAIRRSVVAAGPAGPRADHDRRHEAAAPGPDDGRGEARPVLDVDPDRRPRRVRRAARPPRPHAVRGVRRGGDGRLHRQVRPQGRGPREGLQPGPLRHAEGVPPRPRGVEVARLFELRLRLEGGRGPPAGGPPAPPPLGHHAGRHRRPREARRADPDAQHLRSDLRLRHGPDRVPRHEGHGRRHPLRHRRPLLRLGPRGRLRVRAPAAEGRPEPRR